MDFNTTRRNHMKIAKKLVASLTFFAAVPFLFLACIVVGLPIFASAQASPNAGANAVYKRPHDWHACPDTVDQLRGRQRVHGD
jgi:hypothetical protein